MVVKSKIPGHASSSNGYTFFELILLLALLAILGAWAMPDFGALWSRWDVKTTTHSVRKQLVLARTLAIGNPETHCGVYFDTISTPHRSVLFFDNGNNRYDPGADSLHGIQVRLPDRIAFELPTGLTGGVMIFRGDGSVKGSAPAEVGIRSRKNPGMNVRINVLPSTGRVKVL